MQCNFEKHIQAVEKTLKEIECVGKKQIIIFNKIDAFQYEEKEKDDLTPIKRENLSLEYWEKTWMAKNNKNAVFISCIKKHNIDVFKEKLYDLILGVQKEKYPYNNFLY